MPDANGEPTEEEAVEAIYSYASERMRAGVRGQALVDDLVRQGLDHDTARSVVTNLNHARLQQARGGGGGGSSSAVKHIGIGGLILAIGIAVTVGTYQSAVSKGGGSYTVAYGAIAVGAIELLIGLFQLITGKSD